MKYWGKIICLLIGDKLNYLYKDIMECYVVIKKDEEVFYRYGKIYKIYKVKKVGFRIVFIVWYYLF